MTAPRDTLASLAGRLDDVRREQAWRGIRRRLDAVNTEHRRWPRLLVPTAAAAALVTIAVAVGLRGEPPRSVIQLAASGERDEVLVRDGVTLTLRGPGVALVGDAGDGTLHVHVGAGALVATRTADAPPVTVFAGDTRTVTRDRVFVVRVDGRTVVLGSGERARLLVEHATIAMGAEPPPRKPAHVEPAHVEAAPPAPAPARVKRHARPSAAGLYARAEAALASHDPAGARTLLEQLVRDLPGDPLVDAARYDLALLAEARGDLAAARALLDAIETGGRDANVRAAAGRLRARIAP